MSDLSDFFSNVEAATQPRGKGKLVRPPVDAARDARSAARGIGDTLAPATTSLIMGEPPAPLGNLPDTPQKVPGTGDRRYQEAATELIPLAMGGAPMAGIRTGASAARGVAAGFGPRAVRFAPAAGESSVRDMATNVGAMALGGALSPDEASAQSGLSSKDKARLELQRQQRAIGTDAEATRASNAAAVDRQRQQDLLEADRIKNADNLAAETTRKETENRLAAEKRDADNAYAAAQAKKAQEAPLRETSPNLVKALPAVGLAGAFFPPAITKSVNQMKANKFARGFQTAVDKGEAAIAPGAPELGAKVKTGMRKQLSEFEAAAPEKMDATPSKWVTGLSAMAPTESQLFPAEMDYATLPSGSPHQVEAWNQLTDIPLLAKRLAVGTLQGVPASMLGAKLPPVGRNVRAPIEESPGLRQSLMAPAARKPAAAKEAPEPPQLALPAPAPQSMLEAVSAATKPKRKSAAKAQP